jgi:hypothetical protein
VQQSAVGLGRRRGVLRSSSCCARPRDHLLQLNVHLPWEVEVVCTSPSATALGARTWGITISISPRGVSSTRGAAARSWALR